MPEFEIVAPLSCYGQDEQGCPWGTFSCINCSVVCSVCGKQITRGWQRGRLGEIDLEVCSEHMVFVKAFPAPQQVIPYEGDDAPLHTVARPFCADVTCPCHYDEELVEQALVGPYFDGLLTAPESNRLYNGQQL